MCACKRMRAWTRTHHKTKVFSWEGCSIHSTPYVLLLTTPVLNIPKLQKTKKQAMVCARRSTSDSFRFTCGSRKHLQGIPETARIVPGTPGKKRRRARVIPDPLSVMGYLVMDDAWATRNAARSHFETNDRQVFHYRKNSQNSWNSHKQCLELFQERTTILKSEAKIE